MKSHVTLFACVLLAVCVYESEAGCVSVVGCMRDLFVCKRNELTQNLAVDCCKVYRDCYFECKPTSRSPPCKNKAEGKRGSWNKRYSYGTDMLGDILAGY
ncbi:hypothetical protein SNE40_006078 [Patella caerulea]|uniref:Uncharacterized protein n=1 Tax=Patella caerulea TaxID=87958 RepID=A0AAN8PVM3_PATCE